MKAVWAGIVDRAIFVAFFAALTIMALFSPRRAFEIVQSFMED